MISIRCRYASPTPTPCWPPTTRSFAVIRPTGCPTACTPCETARSCAWWAQKGGGFVDYRDLAGLEGAQLEELIARQVHVFAERGEHFEWKLHGHDRPADLADRLRAAGFVPEE